MIVVTGVGGQLGYDVVKELNKRDIPCKGIDKAELDITDKKAVLSFFEEQRPDAVIHCAAYNAVDNAESDVESCDAVNIYGTENIAAACEKIGAKMMFFSTDYVFSGEKNSEYEVWDKKEPLSVYGRSKSLGEDKIAEYTDKYFILRISWLFGLNGSNFVKTMLRLSKTNKELNVVSDQVGSPTYTKDLAQLICDMIVTEKYGTYHATNEGFCSRTEFAGKIFELAGRDVRVNSVTSEEFSARAVRPLNSRLSKCSLDSAGFSRLPNWEDALERYLKEVEHNS